MHLVVRLLEAGLLTWMALFAVILLHKFVGGGTHQSGFLENARGEGTVAPERALSMVAFPVVIAGYAFAALHADVSPGHPATLPPLSDNLLMLLSGGNGMYLVGKIARIA